VGPGQPSLAGNGLDTALALEKAHGHARKQIMDVRVPKPVSEQLLRRIHYFRRTEKVYRMVAEHPDRFHSLEEAAEAAGMEPSAFSRFFHKAIGTTYTSFQHAYHVSLAIEILLGKHVTVKEVADAVGYGSVSTFSRHFKRMTGSSPAAFRSMVGDPTW